MLAISISSAGVGAISSRFFGMMASACRCTPSAWTAEGSSGPRRHRARCRSQRPRWQYAGRHRLEKSATAVLSIITGGGKWVEITIPADPLYQHLLLTAEKKFWRCVETGEPPRLFDAEPPRARLAAVRIVDMATSNAWGEFAAIYRRTRDSAV